MCSKIISGGKNSPSRGISELSRIFWSGWKIVQNNELKGQKEVPNNALLFVEHLCFSKAGRKGVSFCFVRLQCQWAKQLIERLVTKKPYLFPERGALSNLHFEAVTVITYIGPL
jgi:hypothetical protein